MNANELRVLAISKGRYEVLENNDITNTMLGYLPYEDVSFFGSRLSLQRDSIVLFLLIQLNKSRMGISHVHFLIGDDISQLKWYQLITTLIGFYSCSSCAVNGEVIKQGIKRMVPENRRNGHYVGSAE